MAARAGKDVYCEKPTAITIRESQAVVEAVQRYGRVYQAGTQQRSEYGGKFRQACERVRSGHIGVLKEIYANIGGAECRWIRGFGAGKPVPEGFDWDLWLGPAPWSPYGTTPVSAHTFDGGNWEQHHWDIVQWALDADHTGPIAIGPDWRYANGVVVHGSSYPGEKVGGSGGATFVGTAGRIAVDRENLVAYPPKILEQPLGPNDVHLYKSTSHSGNFLECIRTRKRTICDVVSSHRAASVVLLGGIARRLGRTVHWDPVQEHVINDPEAERLLSVPMRPPWRV
jgi:predicted dehydrogenase